MRHLEEGRGVRSRAPLPETMRGASKAHVWPDPCTRQAKLPPGTPGGPTFAVTFSDGRCGKSEPRGRADGGVILQYSRGSEGSDEWWMAYWLSPLPASGPLTWHAAWPEMGTPEDSVVADAAELIETANDAQVLW